MIGSSTYLVASGDSRLAANRACWTAQAALEDKLITVIERFGVAVERAHPFKEEEGHGFLASQREGMDAFAALDPDRPLIVAIGGWQYSHHVLAGLTTHSGPILTVANWSGQWPGLVGLLNLNASLTKAGVPYSTVWSENLDDRFFLDAIEGWIARGRIEHDARHVNRFDPCCVPARLRGIAETIALDLRNKKAILGVFDEGCMGMFNAIVPDHLLMPMGLFKERLSQSALYHETMQVPPADGEAVLGWLEAKGMRFHIGKDPATELTRDQLVDQCRTYIAAARLADSFGCEAIGIQYQQGLKDLLPASDLAEGLLNNDDRPPVARVNGSLIRDGEAILHFNEVDECAGIDAILTRRVHRALDLPAETTLHDIRWGDVDPESGRFIWVFEISGAAPPAHHGGYDKTDSRRQPPIYFARGGGSVRGIAQPGEIIWSRIFVAGGTLHMDVGRGRAVALSETETERRWNATTYEWPMMHGDLYGITRDQMMARHKANHIQVAYAPSAAQARDAALTKASLAYQLGITVHICGDFDGP